MIDGTGTPNDARGLFGITLGGLARGAAGFAAGGPVGAATALLAGGGSSRRRGGSPGATTRAAVIQPPGTVWDAKLGKFRLPFERFQQKSSGPCAPPTPTRRRRTMPVPRLPGGYECGGDDGNRVAKGRHDDSGGTDSRDADDPNVPTRICARQGW